MVNNLDTHVKNNSTKAGNANRGSQGTKIHNDNKKKSKKTITERKIVSNVANTYALSSTKFMVSGDFNNKIIVKGTCLLTDVVCPVDNSGLCVTDVFPITPNTIPSVRLSCLTMMYYNYIFKKLKVIYRTRQPTSRDGQVGVYFMDDPGEIVSSASHTGYILESMILEGQRGKLEPVYSNFSTLYTGKPFRPFYRCTAQAASIEDSVQTLLVIAAQQPSNSSEVGEPLGLLELEYEIELTRPKSIPPSRAANEKPDFPFYIGSGVAGSQQTLSYARWEIDKNALMYDSFRSKPGIYMITFMEDIGTYSGLNGWVVKPDVGVTMYLKAEYFPMAEGIQFSLYSDWGSLVIDDPIRSVSNWYSKQLRANLHRIVNPTDFALGVGSELRVQRSHEVIQDQVVRSGTVSQGVNQGVYVDPQTDQRNGYCQRILTNYL
jgi:hypothetical protein